MDGRIETSENTQIPSVTCTYSARRSTDRCIPLAGLVMRTASTSHPELVKRVTPPPHVRNLRHLVSIMLWSQSPLRLRYQEIFVCVLNTSLCDI